MPSVRGRSDSAVKYLMVWVAVFENLKIGLGQARNQRSFLSFTLKKS